MLRRMWSYRSLKRLTQHVFAVFSLTACMLLLYSHTNEVAQDALTRRREIMKEKIREEKLRELQKTIFINLKRPDDSTYNINVTLSERTPLERQVPDTRSGQCRTSVYDISTLPTITVIIPFYNEALSMLLRTVHSVLNNTPSELLKEILLVNDHSLNEDLNEPLVHYVKYLPQKVKLLRTRKREGLIRARMIGAGVAQGEVLMFQDAHNENNVGWAEPLLTELKRDPNLIIQPEIDQIDASTLEYIGSNGQVPRGGFSWDLRYTWMEMPDHELRRLHDPLNVRPFRTPTLVGCAMAVYKKHFLDIGGFDDAMEIWGGENIEIAFRNWMCAGEVLTHPCSRVAHTFKPFAYHFDGDREKIVQRNLMRVAELWMDDWQQFFLASTYNWPSKHTYLSDTDRASLQIRKNMKKQMQCKPFSWFLENIVPEIPTPPLEAQFYGEPANIHTESCFQLLTDGYVALTYTCFYHRILPQNLFYIDEQGRLIYHSQQKHARKKCIHVELTTYLLKEGPCFRSTTKEYWTTDLYAENEGQIKVTVMRNQGEKETFCVGQVTNINNIHRGEQMPQALSCTDKDDFQMWRWPYVFDFNYDWSQPPI